MDHNLNLHNFEYPILLCLALGAIFQGMSTFSKTLRTAKRVRGEADTFPTAAREGKTKIRRIAHETSNTQQAGPTSEPGSLPNRSSGLWKFGPHVSAAGGIENAVVRAASVGSVSHSYFRLTCS